jgi:hypothetical protein
MQIQLKMDRCLGRSIDFTFTSHKLPFVNTHLRGTIEVHRAELNVNDGHEPALARGRSLATLIIKFWAPDTGYSRMTAIGSWRVLELVKSSPES